MEKEHTCCSKRTAIFVPCHNVLCSHRGLGNNSHEPRPVLYFTYSKLVEGEEPFVDKVNFTEGALGVHEIEYYQTTPHLSRSERANRRDEKKRLLELTGGSRSTRSAIKLFLDRQNQFDEYDGGVYHVVKEMISRLLVLESEGMRKKRLEPGTLVTAAFSHSASERFDVSSYYGWYNGTVTSVDSYISESSRYTYTVAFDDGDMQSEIPDTHVMHRDDYIITTNESTVDRCSCRGVVENVRDDNSNDPHDRIIGWYELRYGAKTTRFFALQFGECGDLSPSFHALLLVFSLTLP